MAYIVEFAESVKQQLRDLPVRQRALVIEAVEEQLVYEPLAETRNRKPLRPNPVAPWELRVGNLRVFYEVAPDEPNVVRVLAVGRKRGNKLDLLHNNGYECLMQAYRCQMTKVMCLCHD